MSAFSFNHISADKWEAAFGKHDPEAFRKAVRAKRVKASPDVEKCVHIQTDKMYEGYDPGLGAFVQSRAHRKELMKAKGLRECGDNAKKYWQRDYGPRNADGSPK